MAFLTNQKKTNDAGKRQTTIFPNPEINFPAAPPSSVATPPGGRSGLHFEDHCSRHSLSTQQLRNSRFNILIISSLPFWLFTVKLQIRSLSLRVFMLSRNVSWSRREIFECIVNLKLHPCCWCIFSNHALPLKSTFLDSASTHSSELQPRQRSSSVTCPLCAGCHPMSPGHLSIQQSFPGKH